MESFVQTDYRPLISNVMAKIGNPAFLVPARIDQTELLDQEHWPFADVKANLQEMWKLNQAFSGIRAVTKYLKPHRLDPTQPIRIVDLGTGSGLLALHLIRQWAPKHHLPVEVYPLDISLRNLGVAQQNLQSVLFPNLLQANGFMLPFAEHSIDYFISSLFMHHFAPQLLVDLLRHIYRLAGQGIVMSDIVRGYLPLAAFRLIQPIFARHFLTRHDGTVSIKRAYTPTELLHMAHMAGIDHPRVYTCFPWRMTLVADKSYG